MRRRESCCHGRPSLERLTFRGLAAGGKMIEVVVAEDRPGATGETGSDWERADNAASRSPAKSSPGFIVLLFGHRGLNLSRIARSFRRVPSRGSESFGSRANRRRSVPGGGRWCRNTGRRRGEERTGRGESRENLFRGRAGFKSQREVSHPSHRRLEIAPAIPPLPQPRRRRFSCTNQGTFLLGYRGGHFYWALTPHFEYLADREG